MAPRWLRAALPGHDAALVPSGGRRNVELIAIVANPPRGSLMALPKLALIQSLWAGVDACWPTTTLPRCRSGAWSIRR